jgi:hypothetical protein
VLSEYCRRLPINSGYKVARILEKDFTLTLVPLKAKALEVPRSGLLQLMAAQVIVEVTSSTRSSL